MMTWWKGWTIGRSIKYRPIAQKPKATERRNCRSRSPHRNMYVPTDRRIQRYRSVLSVNRTRARDIFFLVEKPLGRQRVVRHGGGGGLLAMQWLWVARRWTCVEGRSGEEREKIEGTCLWRSKREEGGSCRGRTWELRICRRKGGEEENWEDWDRRRWRMRKMWGREMTWGFQSCVNLILGERSGDHVIE